MPEEEDDLIVRFEYVLLMPLNASSEADLFALNCGYYTGEAPFPLTDQDRTDLLTGVKTVADLQNDYVNDQTALDFIDSMCGPIAHKALVVAPSVATHYGGGYGLSTMQHARFLTWLNSSHHIDAPIWARIDWDEDLEHTTLAGYSEGVTGLPEIGSDTSAYSTGTLMYMMGWTAIGYGS